MTLTRSVIKKLERANKEESGLRMEVQKQNYFSKNFFEKPNLKSKTSFQNNYLLCWSSEKTTTCEYEITKKKLLHALASCYF